jgi:hypothetical protein
MNHQVEDLTRFRLELKSFDVCCHGGKVYWGGTGAFKVGGRYVAAAMNP